MSEDKDLNGVDDANLSALRSVGGEAVGRVCGTLVARKACSWTNYVVIVGLWMGPLFFKMKRGYVSNHS